MEQSREERMLCPKCNSPDLHRSRTRGVAERVRKFLSESRLYRCHRCGWRGWISVDGVISSARSDRTAKPFWLSMRRKVSYQYMFAVCLALILAAMVIKYCAQ